MEGGIASPAYPVLGTLSRLAASLSDPFATFDRDSWGVGDFSPSEIEAIAADPAFRPPLRRALARRLTAGLAGLSPDDFIRIAAVAEGRLAIAMLGAPVEEILDLALLCAGAAFHREILGTTGKPERAALRTALGANAYLLATQEASGLYPALAALGDARQFRSALGEGDPDAARRQFVACGLALLLALVDPVAPSLCDLIARRLPPDCRPGASASAGPADIRRLLKLVERRKPTWLATTG